jgi:hypothetical protein
MNREQPGTAALAQFLVWLASGIVPGSGRREWIAEWNAELCHVCRSCSCDPVRFTLGAFQDALWIRSDHVGSRILPLLRRGSAAGCLAKLLLLAATGVLLCLFLPGARRAISAAVDRTPADLVVISSDGYQGTQSPSIPLSDYQEWRTDASQLFTQIAFCRPVAGRLRVDGHPPVNVKMAVASESLLRMLDLSDPPAGSPDARGPKLFLTQSAWRIHFHADRHVIGATTVIEGTRAVIAGVIPDRTWRLPGEVEALLTENSHQLDSLPPGANGFVFAQLRISAFPAAHNGWYSIFEWRPPEVLHFDCIPFAWVFGLPLRIFLFALLMACVALPATTALRLGDYPERRGRLGRAVNLRRWVFLAVKVLLVVPIVGLWSFALAYAAAPAGSSASLYIQLGTSLPALLFAFRWALHDQRRRCPVCLRLLSNPARVGQPSWNFLAWCGIELICQSGHGLLHIPELPTCWFSTQRWLCLDTSWASLFPGDPAAP